MIAHMLSLEVSGKVGIGTIVTLVIAIVACVYGFFRWQQGDPSEWRENYLGEVARREEMEKRVAAQDEHIRQLEAKIVVLEQTRSLEPVLAALEKTQSASESLLQTNTAMLSVLQLLADRLSK